MISPYVFPGIKRTKSFVHEIIIQTIKDLTDVKFEDIASPVRRVKVVDARKIYCHQAKTRLKWSLREIGVNIGGRDHTTVIHNLRTYGNSLRWDENFKTIANAIDEEINFRKKLTRAE